MLSVSQASERVGVSRDVVMAWIRSGKLPHSNLGGGDKKPRYFVDPLHLDEFLRSRSSRGVRQIPQVVKDYF
jgi:excisionase family DNA binding protein